MSSEEGHHPKPRIPNPHLAESQRSYFDKHGHLQDPNHILHHSLTDDSRKAAILQP